MSFKIKKTNRRSMYHKKYIRDSKSVYQLDYIGDGIYDVYELVTTIFSTESLVHVCRQSLRDLDFHIDHEDPAYKWYILDEKPNP